MTIIGFEDRTHFIFSKDGKIFAIYHLEICERGLSEVILRWNLA